MLANMGGRLEKLKYATVFTLFDPTGLFRGDGAAYAGAAVLLALGLGFTRWARPCSAGGTCRCNA